MPLTPLTLALTLANSSFAPMGCMSERPNKPPLTLGLKRSLWHNLGCMSERSERSERR